MNTAVMTYVTPAGKELTANIECLDFEDSMDMLEHVMDWCNTRNFKLKQCVIHDDTIPMSER